MIQVEPWDPERRKVRDLTAFFRGPRMTRDIPPYDPARARMEGPGEPYEGARSIPEELTHVLGMQGTLHHLAMQQQHIGPAEWRDLHLRQAALSDRLHLTFGGEDYERAAIEAAWLLQVEDCKRRDLVIGPWQPDAIHWPQLTADPSSGCRDYVRQEYAAWRAVIREAHRAG
jgi:hypothetical protein